MFQEGKYWRSLFLWYFLNNHLDDIIENLFGIQELEVGVHLFLRLGNKDMEIKICPFEPDVF